MRCYLNEMEASSQIKPEGYVNGKSIARSFSIKQPPKHRIFTTGYLHGENYPPFLEEGCTAVRQLRNIRVPGEDGIPAEG